MDRRRFLQSAGVACSVGLAGCLGVLGSDGPDSADEPAPAPDGESYTFEGSNHDETDVFTLEEGLAAFDIQNTGYGHVGLELQKPGNTYGTQLVNEVSDEDEQFDGTSATGVEAGEFQLYGTADQWEVTVRQPRFSEAEYESVPFEGSGTDYDLLGPFEFERDTRVTLDREDEQDDLVIVELLSIEGVDAGRVLSGRDDSVEHYASSTVGQSGPGLMAVETTGSWSLTVEQP